MEFMSEDVRSRRYELNPGEPTLELYIVQGRDLVCSCDTGSWDQPGVWVNRLVTHEAYFRQGAARTVIGYVIGLAIRRGKEAVSLNVRTDNGAAIALYRALGFFIAFQHGDKPDEMYTMVRQLGGG